MKKNKDKDNLNENESIDNNEETITNDNTTEENIQSNDGKQEVEVDKIFQLLQDAKRDIKNKSSYDKNRKDRLDKIINDIPTSSLNQFKPEDKPETPNDKNLQHEKMRHQEHVNKPEQKKGGSGFFTFILILIIAGLGYLQYETYLKEKNNTNKSLIHKTTPKFSDLLKSVQNQYVLKNSIKTNNTKPSNKKLEFKILPKNIKDKYVLKQDFLVSKEHSAALMKKSDSLENHNKLLKKQITILEDENIDKDDKRKMYNRNLLKELNLFKVEQEKYTNEIASFKMNKKTNIAKIEELTSKNITLEKDLLMLKETKPEVKTIVKTIIKKVPTEVTNNNYDEVVKNELFPAITSKSKDYKFVKCYDLKAGNYYLTPKCKRDIAKLVKNNKNAKRFEIIGVVDKEDFTTLYQQNQRTEESLLLQKFNSMGLSRYRVLETSWFISKQLESKVKLTPVNYTITSKKDNRGTIVRAYSK